MNRQISVKPYRRAFRQPLRTAHGEWTTREGFLVRVEQDGCTGYGEVAPLPSFGSETLAEAKSFLEQLESEPEMNTPANLPCCAFALSSAQIFAERGSLDLLKNEEAPAQSASRAFVSRVTAPPRDYSVCALLPSGSVALRIAVEKSKAGYQNMKWKIGVEPIAEEISTARSLFDCLPSTVRLRFDGNAGLAISELEQWLEFLIPYRKRVDFIEQPLACGQEALMGDYMEASGIGIALDESLNVADYDRWLTPNAWSGALVIKAPLMGELSQLADRLAPVAKQVVFSSVFETGIGLENSLRLADSLPQVLHPIGYDTVNAFNDGLNYLQAAPTICTSDRLAYYPDLLWNLI
ncbi:MAG: o-succinylbenzoate synthase [Verrucomicrobiota bacterium]|nr:o-succinylbenzoate synthase [Verrucomicrobiota bacterium]MEC7235247.1 o-succinylbenzoate synthase [Verrucomicrobiota bacterium]MEE2988909.1 o-succinylbenzoate synthase [Verrucomicrobiota bacterium]